jgi:LmbE family N-acetylglucosaminyl deacetylase
MSQQAMQEERDLVPYTAEGVIQAARVLVVAPHPDDEVFGCGGCARLHVLAGAAVDVLVLTDGSGAGVPAVRAAESVAACAALGLKAPAFWAYPDRALGFDDHLLQGLSDRLQQAIMQGGHDLVYAPSPWEVHPDHRATAWAVARSVRLSRLAGSAVRWAAYEVGVPLWPHRLVNVDAVWADKRAAMSCFGSQLAFQPYDEHITALNRYRSYTVSGQCRYAEALWLPDEGALQAVESGRAKGWPHPCMPDLAKQP